MLTGRGAAARAHHARRAGAPRRAVPAHRDAHARGHGRHAAGGRLGGSPFRSSTRAATFGHAPRRHLAGCAHDGDAPGGPKAGTVQVPLPAARVPRGRGGDAGEGARAHADGHRVHRRGGRARGRRRGRGTHGRGAGRRARAATRWRWPRWACCGRCSRRAGRPHGGRSRCSTPPCVELRGARPPDGAWGAGPAPDAEPGARAVCARVRGRHPRAAAHPRRARGYRRGARARGAAGLRGRPRRVRPHVYDLLARRPGASASSWTSRS